MDQSQFTSGAIRFVCDQDGAGERTLKNAISARLEASGIVGRAYLVRVDYGNSDEFNVALCLRVLGGDEGLAKDTVAETFHHLFSASEHLDVLILTELQELNLQQVAKPVHIGPRD